MKKATKQNGESRKRSIYILSIDFDKGAKTIFSTERMIFSKIIPGATDYLDTK